MQSLYSLSSTVSEARRSLLCSRVGVPLSVRSITVREVTNAEDQAFTDMKCVLCVRALARVQSTVNCCLFTVGMSVGHFGNVEYIESYGKTYNGYIYIYVYMQTRSLYFSYMWGSLWLTPIRE